MTIAFDVSGHGTHTNATSPKQFTLVTNTTDTIIISAWTNVNNTVSALKVDSTTATSIGNSTAPIGNGFTWFGYVQNVAAGSHTIEVDYTGTTFVDLFASAYSGVTSVASASATGAATNTYNPTTTTASGDYLVLVGSNGDGPGGGYTVSGSAGTVVRETISNAASSSGLFIADSNGTFGAGTNGITVTDAENGNLCTWNTFMVTLSAPTTTFSSTMMLMGV